jgi:hypothetical protein
MCDFHSTAWRLVGQDIQCAHLSTNSHSGMIKAAGWKENQPNRKIQIFEAEWDGVGDLPSDTRLIRNFGECPEKVRNQIRKHYQKLKEAITEGKHFDLYFADTEKWADVWNRAIANGVAVTLPKVFKGHLDVSGSAKLDAPALTEVGGSLDVSGSAKLDAPKLKRSDFFVPDQGGNPPGATPNFQG